GDGSQQLKAHTSHIRWLRVGRSRPLVAAYGAVRRGRDRRAGVSAMRLLLRFMGWVFAGGTIVFLIGVTATAGLLWHFSRELPDYSQLQDYEPAVMTRVHASDGSLLAEYAKERRLYIPLQAVPQLVSNAFTPAECRGDE